MAKENKSKNEKKHKKRKTEKQVEETVKQPEDTSVKSIADLFGSGPTDPALEALFKANVGPGRNS